MIPRYFSRVTTHFSLIDLVRSQPSFKELPDLTLSGTRYSYTLSLFNSLIILPEIIHFYNQLYQKESQHKNHQAATGKGQPGVPGINQYIDQLQDIAGDDRTHNQQ